MSNLRTCGFGGSALKRKIKKGVAVCNPPVQEGMVFTLKPGKIQNKETYSTRELKATA